MSLLEMTLTSSNFLLSIERPLNGPKIILLSSLNRTYDIWLNKVWLSLNELKRKDDNEDRVRKDLKTHWLSNKYLKKYQRVILRFLTEQKLKWVRYKRPMQKLLLLSLNLLLPLLNLSKDLLNISKSKMCMKLFLIKWILNSAIYYPWMLI